MLLIFCNSFFIPSLFVILCLLFFVLPMAFKSLNILIRIEVA